MDASVDRTVSTEWRVYKSSRKELGEIVYALGKIAKVDRAHHAGESATVQCALAAPSQVLRMFVII